MHFLRISDFKSKAVSDLAALSVEQTLGWQIKSYDFKSIWAQTKGKGIKVAVIDSAVDINHQDLVIEGGWDFTKNAALSPIPPKQVHGTHVAGIIGARDNGMGIVGVAPECSLYSLATLGEDGKGNYAHIIKALDWCITNKMDVINMSLGGGKDVPEFYKAIRRVYDANIPIICAAGNSAWESGYVDFPASYNETITIAALNKKFQRAIFSSIGSNIDVSAPGEDILSTTPKNSYSLLSGTSMAAPFVTGLVALMLAKHRLDQGSTPIHTVEDVRQHIIRTAKDDAVAGQDSFIGYGLVSPEASLNFEKEKPILESKDLLEGIRVKLSEDFLKEDGTVIGKSGDIKTVNLSVDELKAKLG